MGFHDSEPPNPLDLFPTELDPMALCDPELQQRVRAGEGRAILRRDQLDDPELAGDPQVRLQYDRFAPGLSLRPQ